MSSDRPPNGARGLLRGHRTRSYGSIVNSSLSPVREKRIEHQVQPGETLQGLALKYGVSVSDFRLTWSSQFLELTVIKVAGWPVKVLFMIPVEHNFRSQDAVGLWNGKTIVPIMQPHAVWYTLINHDEQTFCRVIRHWNTHDQNSIPGMETSYFNNI